VFVMRLRDPISRQWVVRGFGLAVLLIGSAAETAWRCRHALWRLRVAAVPRVMRWLDHRG
jgi:hypothetical protein